MMTMQRYAVFIRAVNVGGRSVRMDEITRTLAKAGFQSPSSFRQSGNLVLGSPFTDESTTGRMIK
jgi:uncharacterized protein (DUF1697 family)